MVDTKKRNKRQYQWQLDNTERINFTMPKGMKERIQKAADVLGLKRSEFIREAINEKIDSLRVDSPVSQDDEKSTMEIVYREGEAIKERKVGKWVTKFHGFPPEPTTVCSKCDFDRDFYIRIGFDKIKYCPNCGCRMFEPQESEDKA